MTVIADIGDAISWMIWWRIYSEQKAIKLLISRELFLHLPLQKSSELLHLTLLILVSHVTQMQLTYQRRRYHVARPILNFVTILPNYYPSHFLIFAGIMVPKYNKSNNVVVILAHASY